MFKKNVLMGMLALAFVTLAAREVLAWGLDPDDPLYGCLDPNFCSYQGKVTIKGAKGKSVAAGAVSVAMQQVAEQAQVFCANPNGFIQNGQSFRVNTTAFQSVGATCDTRGKCPVMVHQATTVLDLPAVCSGTLCPAVCNNGENNGTPPPPADTGEQCLARIYGLQLEGQAAVCNNNFHLFGVAWGAVDLTFIVLEFSNPVATLKANCTSPDGLQLDQPNPWICQVQ
jgi:hypothetical protein